MSGRPRRAKNVRELPTLEILKIRIHSDIRALILKETRILRIAHLGRPFYGVFTPVIRLDLQKCVSAEQSSIVIEGPDGPHIVEQERFRSNKHFAFDANVMEGEDDILTRLHAAKFVTLKGHADWALGIVTGNNKAFVSHEPSGSMRKLSRGLTPVFLINL